MKNKFITTVVATALALTMTFSLANGMDVKAAEITEDSLVAAEDTNVGNESVDIQQQEPVEISELETTENNDLSKSSESITVDESIAEDILATQADTAVVVGTVSDYLTAKGDAKLYNINLPAGVYLQAQLTTPANADYHAGFCLVYQKEDIEDAKRYGNTESEVINKTVLTRINYVEQQLDMTNDVLEYIRNNMFDTMGDVPQVDSSLASAKIRQVITEKSKDWAYEKEWRLIPRIPKIETESPLYYIECKPIAAIIGSQCFGKNREKLVKICERIDVPVYGIFLKENDPKCRLELNDDGNIEVERHEYFYYYNG